MNERINWSDLKKSTAKRCNSSEKEVGAFMNAMVEAIREGLIAEGSVKVNGLGTFATKPVAARKSINVNTGEEIIIPSYNKVSFQAEAAMKDVLKYQDPTPALPLREGEKSETYEKVAQEEDPIKKIGEQATEILDILAEINRMAGAKSEEGVEDSEEVRAKIEEPVESEEPETPEDSVEPVESEDSEEPVETVVEPETEPEAKPETKQEEKPEQSKGWKIGSIVVLILAVLLVVGYLGWGYWEEHRVQQPIEPVMADTVQTPAEEPEELPLDTLLEEATISEPEATINEPEATNPERDYSQTLTIAELRNGSRLTLLAERYYGNKDLWVFIYEANKDRLPSPHKITVGTKIIIPKLDECWQDTTNATTKAEMARLKAIYEAMK